MVRRSVVIGVVAACSLALSVHAQETTVKSKTKVKVDDAKAVTLTGCLQAGTETGWWMLSNVVPPTTLKTVGTTGTVTSYMLSPKDGVDLSAHVGHRVEITALEIAAKTATDDDAKIKVEDKTKIKKENAPDEKIKTKTKAEIARGPMPKLTVLSIKHISPTCM